MLYVFAVCVYGRTQGVRLYTCVWPEVHINRGVHVGVYDINRKRRRLEKREKLEKKCVWERIYCKEHNSYWIHHRFIFFFSFSSILIWHHPIDWDSAPSIGSDWYTSNFGDLQLVSEPIQCQFWRNFEGVCNNRKIQPILNFSKTSRLH